MEKKDEIVQRIIATMIEFIKLTELDWDATYYRYVALGGGSCSSECLFRKERELNYFLVPPRTKQTYINVLQEMAEELSREMGKGGATPVVLVASVDKELNYNMKFDYENPKGLEIRLLSLGSPNSYFGNEVDIPKEATNFNNELKKI